MAKIKIAGIKGMPDMLPEESAVWEFFTDTAPPYSVALRFSSDPHADS